MVNHRRNADCGLKQHYLKLANEERIFDRREIVGGGGGVNIIGSRGLP